MRHIMMTISYDGSNYIGWQRQEEEKGISIQGVLEQALFRLLRERVTVAGAGRTDGGVHAWGQKASFHTEKNIPAAQIPYALNCFLPKDIRVRDAVEVDAAFHVRFDAAAKEYRYVFLQGKPDAFNWRQAYFFQRPADFDLMQQGANLFLGTHDFRAFTVNSRREIGSYVRTITKCQFRPVLWENPLIPESPGSLGYWLDVWGEGFLYKMVRLLASSLLALGQGKIGLDDIRRALEQGGPILAPPLPACGLTLIEVNYENKA